LAGVLPDSEDWQVVVVGMTQLMTRLQLPPAQLSRLTRRWLLCNQQQQAFFLAAHYRLLRYTAEQGEPGDVVSLLQGMADAA
jgi:hypothetical protein